MSGPAVQTTAALEVMVHQTDLPATKKKTNNKTNQQSLFDQCCFLNSISHISAVPAFNILQVYEYMASMKLEKIS